jgi:hypothetical protein
MKVHADPAAPEGHALEFEPQALFPAFRTLERDATAGRHDPVPGQSRNPLQRPYRRAGRPRESGRRSSLTIGDHFSARHSGDHRSNPSH